MKSANLMVFEGKNIPLAPYKTSIPDLTDGEILIRNLYTSICGSDIHTYCGLRNEKLPTVLGHEIVGEIVAFSDKHDRLDFLGNLLKIGDRVTWSIFSSDLNSTLSKAGMPQKGDNLFKYGHAQFTDNEILNGGMSTHCILKKGTAVLPVSEQVPLPVAAIINCAVATVCGAIRLAGEIKNKKVLITGSGLLGLVCTAMSISLEAKHVTVFDVDQSRLDLARQFGADEVYNTKNSIAHLSKDFDIAFDMSGSADAMESGLNLLGIGGIAIWIGAVFNTRKVHVDAESIVRRIISIKGLHNYNFEDFVTAVNFISKNHMLFPFNKVVSKEYSLAETNDAFQYAVNNKPIRVGINLQSNESNNDTEF